MGRGVACCGEFNLQTRWLAGLDGGRNLHSCSPHPGWDEKEPMVFIVSQPWDRLGTLQALPKVPLSPARCPHGVPHRTAVARVSSCLPPVRRTLGRQRWGGPGAPPCTEPAGTAHT